MAIPWTIAAFWIVASGLFWGGDRGPLAAVALALSPVALLLTVWLRRKKTSLAAKEFLDEQAERGVGAREAAERVEELAPDGVVIDTDDLPQWPFKAILLLGLGGLVTAVVACVGFLRG